MRRHGLPPRRRRRNSLAPSTPERASKKQSALGSGEGFVRTGRGGISSAGQVHGRADQGRTALEEHGGCAHVAPFFLALPIHQQPPRDGLPARAGPSGYNILRMTWKQWGVQGMPLPGESERGQRPFSVQTQTALKRGHGVLAPALGQVQGFIGAPQKIGSGVARGEVRHSKAAGNPSDSARLP